MTNKVSESYDINVAEILHDIAAQSDAISGKIIRKAQKAANAGKTSILVKISNEDRYPIQYDHTKLTAPMEHLINLGFQLEIKIINTFLDPNGYRLEVRW